MLIVTVFSKKNRPQPKSGPLCVSFPSCELYFLILSQAEDDLHEHVHEERCRHKKAETHDDTENEVYEHLLRLLFIVLLSGYDIGDPYRDAPNCGEDPKQHEQ